MDPARGRGSAGGEAGRGVGRGEALAQLLAARKRESSVSGVSVGRGQLLRQLATGSQTDGSSVASVGGGRGELLRRIAKQLLRGQQLRVWQTGHHPSRRKSWHGECSLLHF